MALENTGGIILCDEGLTSLHTYMSTFFCFALNFPCEFLFFFKKKGAVQLRWIDLQNSVHVIVVESLFHTCEWFYYLMKKNHVSMTTFVSSNLSIKTAVLITKGQTRKKVPWLDISDSPYSGPSWECLERQRKQQLNRPETLLGQ